MPVKKEKNWSDSLLYYCFVCIVGNLWTCKTLLYKPLKKYLITEAIINKPNVVKLMHELRTQLSLDMMNMNFEEQKVFLKKSLKELKKKRKKVLQNCFISYHFPNPKASRNFKVFYQNPQSKLPK